MRGRGAVALGLGAAGLVAGSVAEHALLRRRRRHDPERDEPFGKRRGERSGTVTTADGVRLFYEEVGPVGGAGAVFVHGSALRTDVWHYQMAGIGGHRLVLYDQRGHGRYPDRGSGPYTIPRLASDLVEVIEQVGLEEAVVVGHSVGGMVAMQACLDRPDLQGSSIRGLVLLNTTYGPATETFVGGALVARFERFLRRPFDVVSGQAARIDVLRRIVRPSDAMFWAVAFAAFGPGASARQVDFVYDMVAETPSEVVFDLVRSFRDFDVRDRLDEITVPCLVVGGSHDRLTLPGASTALAAGLPKAELRILEGCGHMSMLERHEEVNALVRRFLDDVLGPGGGRRG